MPPTAGFVGKLYVFKAAVGAQLYPLAIVGILTSVLGAFYYLRVVVHMYMKPAEGSRGAGRRAGHDVRPGRWPRWWWCSSAWSPIPSSGWRRPPAAC